MTRYYFDVREGQELALDEEGLELNSMQAAQLEAAKSLADIVRDAVHQCPPKHKHHMAIEVRDENGPVMQVKFTFKVEKTLQ
ncbi:DUF6894 family protein [Bradyrhizobium elkanii]|uniref:DUF6894 family protein n=1 Tax=Bradyrhizobium elkanii TaxID=29448 RepID=UPI00056E240E|nr:hypothetical protein [Bradyrhizobium elkanii]WLA85187.1 hypothetical protein QNJ99_13750 [Bradyrhizobium elkanii]